MCNVPNIWIIKLGNFGMNTYRGGREKRKDGNPNSRRRVRRLRKLSQVTSAGKALLFKRRVFQTSLIVLLLIPGFLKQIS